MAEKKDRKITRNVRGSWNVKYKWQFEAGMLKRYVAGLKDKKIIGTKCPACGRVYAPPTPRCGKCFVELDDFVEVKSTGKAVMYTATFNTITGAPLPEPNITAMVQLDGADSWVMARIMGIKPEDMRTGLPVKVVWAKKTKGEISDIDHYEPL